MPLKLKPKDRYLNPPDKKPGVQSRADQWADICTNPIVQEAFEVAFAEYSKSLAASNQMEAMSCYYRLEGARDFIETILNLGEKVKTPLSNATPQLIPT